MSAQQLVLIVSADPKEQRVLTVSLRRAGLGVRTATDGFDALHQLEEDDGRITVVTVDLELPQMDGFEFCERLRENARFDAVPLVAVTGSRDLATKLRAFEVGYEELIHKPVFIKEVAARIELLIQRRAHDELVEASAKEVSGKLDAVSVIDLIQAIEARQRTGHARLVGPNGELAALFFEQGMPIDAEVGNMRGVAALNRVMRWEEGSFAVKYLPRIRRRRRIHDDPDVLVSDGLERMERFYQLITTLPPMDRLYEVDYDAVGSELATMPGPVRIMLRLFDGLRTLEQVVSDAPVDDLEALRVVERLLVNAQVVEVTTPAVRESDDDHGPDVDHENALKTWLGLDSDSGPHRGGWRGRQPHTLDRQASPGTPAVASERRWDYEEEAINLVAEAARREEERAQLEDERRRLRYEQSSILAALARSEPEPLGHLEHGHSDEGLSDEDLNDETPIPWADAGIDYTEPAASDSRADAAFNFNDDFSSSPGRKQELDLASALHDRMADAFEGFDEPFEPEPVQEEDPQALAWMEVVRAHEAQYRVYRVEHALKKRTMIIDEPDESAARGFGRARLAVSDVYDAVPATDHSDIDVDMRFESGPTPTVRAQGEASRTDTRPGRSGGGSPSDLDRQSADSARASAERRRAEYERAATESSRRADRRRFERERPETPSDERPLDHAGHEETHDATPFEEPQKHRAPTASVPADDLPVESPREKNARRAGPRSDAATEARPSGPDLQPISSPDMAAIDRGRVSGTFEHNFFQPSGEFDAARKASKTPTYILMAILILMMGAVLYVVVFRSGKGTPEGEEIKAEHAAPESSPPVEDPFEEDDPFEAQSAEPLAAPEVIDAEYQASSTAEGVLKTATAVASLTAGRPADTSIAGAAEVDIPAPKEVAKPTPRVEKPAPTPKPKTVKPPTEPRVADAPDKPKDKPAVSIEKSTSGGGTDKLVSTGKKAYDKRKYGDAIASLEKAVAQESGNTEANFYLGLSYAKSGNAKLALKHLEKVKGAKKGKAEFWKELGTVYIRLKMDKDGLEAYRKAIDLLGADHPDAKKLQKYLDSRS